MSKILRLFTVSLLLGSIMIASFAGTVFAGGHGVDDKGKGADNGDQVRLYDCDDDCDGDGPWWDTEN